MRQKSTAVAELAGARDLRIYGRPTAHLAGNTSPSTRDSSTRRAARYAAATTDRRQARRDPPSAAAGTLATPPTPSTSSCDAQLLRRRIARGEQHDLGAPPLPATVALGHMRDDPRGLQVIKPALHALAMCAHKAAPLTATAWDMAPAHHRRQADHQLLHRGRVLPRPRRVTEAKQVSLDRVDPRLDPIITWRDTTPRPTRAAQQRAHHQPTGLARQRRLRRPIPTTIRRPGAGKRCAFQRHRQRPRTPGARRTQRSRADARGAAGPASSSRERGGTGTRRPQPSGRGSRSVRRTATVGEQGICRRFSRSTEWLEDRSGKTGIWPPVFRVLCGHGGVSAYTSSTSWPIAQRVVTRSRIWARSASRRSKLSEMRWKRRYAGGVRGSGDEPVSPAFRDISRH
jgi:hypothetical protein